MQEEAPVEFTDCGSRIAFDKDRDWMEVAEQLGQGVNILSVDHHDLEAKLTKEASCGLELGVKTE